MDWESQPWGSTTAYKLDPVIAQRIKELRLGLNGCRIHSWRALALRVTGFEDQMTGSELERLAQWTLGDSDEEWDLATKLSSDSLTSHEPNKKGP